VRRPDPHLVLGVGALLVVAAEAGYRTWISDVWLFLQAAIAFAGLVYAWREQDRLRGRAVLALTAGFALAWMTLHLAVDVTADRDSDTLFRWQGNALRRGDYPRSEYPLGAVLLFAFEAWVGGGATRAVNAFLMIPFHVACVGAVLATRTRHAPWLAAVVGLWPLNAYYWEFKFDLVPAALLAFGLVLALRGRWGLSGFVLAVGALVKWTPGLAAVALVAWLLASRRGREAVSHAAVFVATVVLVYVPFLLWSPSEVLHAYDRQSGRTITAESVWFLLLRPLDLAHVRDHISFSAGAPDWANAAATVAQLLLLVLVVAVAVRARGNVRAAVVAAALAPVVFLLTNRIFSPQFIVIVFAAVALAGALLVRTAREQLALGLALAAASFGNAFVFPFALPYYDVTWQLASLVLFTCALAATAWLLRRAALSPAP
jgi:Glycosyltransferase family 87